MTIVGQRYGTLTAQQIIPGKNGGSGLCICTCDCAHLMCPETLVVRTKNLKSGNTRSCRKHRYGTTIHLAIRNYYSQNKGRAKQLGYIFTLTLEQFHTIIKQSCTYCGNNSDIKQIDERYRLRANGIDRVDNTLGYIIENCVPCCQRCNVWKRAMPVQEFIQHCKKVAEFNGS